MLSQQQLLRLMPSPGGTDLTGMAGLLTATATTEKGLQTLNQQLKLMPNPGGTETMDTTDTLPMAMATMERDLLTLAQRKGVKKVDTRNDELHQPKQSWTMAKQKTQEKKSISLHWLIKLLHWLFSFTY